MMGRISHIDLIEDPSRAAQLPARDVHGLLARLTSVQATLVAHLQSIEPDPTPSCVDDRLLTAEEVAERTHMSRDYIYRHARTLPFARRIGRAIRFSEAGLNEWLSRQHLLD